MTYGALNISSEYVTSPVRPLYTCDGRSQSVLLSDWYYNCRESCSPFFGLYNSTIHMMKDTSDVVQFNVYKVSYIINQVSSHTDLFNNCNYLHSTHPYVIPDEDMAEMIKKLIPILQKGESSFLVENASIPNCSYFTDHYVSYDSTLGVKTIGKLVYDQSTGESMISIPSLSIISKSDSPWIRYGEEVIIWDPQVPKDVSCSLKDLGNIGCIYYPNKFIMDCPTLGIRFNQNGTAGGKCIGQMKDYSYHGHGYYGKVVSTYAMGNPYGIIDVLSKTLEQDIINVVAQINTAYGRLTDTLCESVCDISDQVFSIKGRSTSVIETPIGPWLSWRNPTETFEHIFYISACRRISNWSIKSPLNPCHNTSGFVISDQEDHQEIWDPRFTYFVAGETCNDFEQSTFHQDIIMNKTTRISFWGKDLILRPPYNVSAEWEDPGHHIFRSSKWLPYIHGIDVNSSYDLYVLMDGVNKYSGHIQNISRIVKGSSMIKSLWTGLSQFVDSLTSSFSSFFDIQKMLGKTIMIILKVLPVILIIIVLSLTYKLTMFAFGRRNTTVTNNANRDNINAAERLLNI